MFEVTDFQAEKLSEPEKGNVSGRTCGEIEKGRQGRLPFESR